MDADDMAPIYATCQSRCKPLIMYGSDFPNIPYAWDRELKSISRAGLDAEALEGVLWKNAARFYKFEIKMGVPA
jgi:predicted TIM-barrel fold metal-dependent hydrolase